MEIINVLFQIHKFYLQVLNAASSLHINKNRILQPTFFLNNPSYLILNAERNKAKQ